MKSTFCIVTFHVTFCTFPHNIITHHPQNFITTHHPTHTRFACIKHNIVIQYRLMRIKPIQVAKHQPNLTFVRKRNKGIQNARNNHTTNSAHRTHRCRNGLGRLGQQRRHTHSSVRPNHRRRIHRRCFDLGIREKRGVTNVRFCRVPYMWR